MEASQLELLLRRWREDEGATYRTWFLWEERLKNFRSIRCGLSTVVGEIAAGTFGTTYKGSSLEVLVKSIAEQRQIFRGADHAFLWKPKLRIPDIYESPDNQRAFGRFLEACLCCSAEDGVVRAIRELCARKIKGLGPASANLLYFLHPTIVPPFNTAIVKGYNDLTGARVKLGSWDGYLAMRDGILRLNGEQRGLLSNDLGAVGGFLFDLGSGRYRLPQSTQDARAWEEDLQRVRAYGAQLQQAVQAADASDHSHLEVQGWLRDLGKQMGFNVWIAANDQNRPFAGGRLGEGCLPELPPALREARSAQAIRLIDVLWLDPSSEQVAAAFEVEHSTSIYSGIIRMLDLALGGDSGFAGRLFLVAPDDREEDVRAQLRRPAFSPVSHLKLRYLKYGDLARNREAMARFGSGIKAVEAIACEV